jgi:hypothetical protein
MRPNPMESQRSLKNTGGGTPLAATVTVEPDSAPLCSYRSKTGNRCRMLAADADSPFCPHHYSQNLKRQRREGAARANLLLGTMRQFPTAEHVNCFLGNLLTQLAFGRIDRRDALTLAYVSQLLLNTYPAMERERKEELDGFNMRAFLDAVDKARAQVDAAQASNGAPPQSKPGERP